ncbi:MAG: hypothetical protein WA460_02250 [Nitrososphaeraceae archaeon]
MPHILARLKGVNTEDIKKVLKADAPQHAEQGLYLEHLWQNADDLEEVVFLFRIENLIKAKEFTNKVHTEALAKNPQANLPYMTFLEESQL